MFAVTKPGLATPGADRGAPRQMQESDPDPDETRFHEIREASRRLPRPGRGGSSPNRAVAAPAFIARTGPKPTRALRRTRSSRLAESGNRFARGGVARGRSTAKSGRRDDRAVNHRPREDACHPLCCWTPAVGVDRPRPCRAFTRVDRRATRVSGIRLIHRQSKRSSP